MSDAFKPFIGKAAKAALPQAEANAAFDLLLDGEASPAQIAGFLMALSLRGESLDEISGAVSAMRQRMVPVNAPEGAMDIVGTGGDGKATLNISTATAFVVAGAGVVVAKHGNRNISSRSGTADALSELGVNVMVGAEVVARALREAGIGFMMAPMHHPALKHVMPVRQELGVRTLFNILGPMCSPAGVRFQLTGAYDRALIRPMAEVLGRLGSRCAWLVHGGDGTDELSIAGPSFVAAWEGGEVHEFELHPEEAGLPTHPFSAIVGGTPAENAQALKALLQGASGAYRDAVLLNAAAALRVAGRAANLVEGREMAEHAIDSGAARDKAARLAQITTEATA